ncbi:leucyl/phenylalanyl-tRNA--protein transferase [Paracoccus contaminans]|uniref:Leucyl/phenylalanyl-tRNA--protein transferase n=1 Tax=Paracoccus contaminans TaxID=1945662 RepID=A0A1W6D096_9RHOB|nr:leucyl/phenylalanyl-tRNA--protein transferase [Paracoccus contaminans]ARJ70553.1 leucyl/phenylalanyl-tRNA--protein transferase [Paracoccus contaminans]
MIASTRLTPAELLAGYANGIFPMAGSAGDPGLSWFNPPRRGILPVGGVHASRSLLRELARGGWTADAAPRFDLIVDHCANRPETWINAPLRALYAALHEAGHAHALAVYKGGVLAGGLFGVSLGGAFFGESMFSTQASGSRIALLWLSDHLDRCGFTLLDTQYRSAHLASMGGLEIPRPVYQARLAEALQLTVRFDERPLQDAAGLLDTLRARRA